MSVRVRFAPSPTGPLHIGGVRTALFNFLFAKKNNGKFILRIEDTDRNRYVPGAEDHIKNSLKWLGIEWDEGPDVGGPFGPYRQSERVNLYREYAELLVKKGHAYYAFDTPEELEAFRERLRKAGVPNPQYNSITRQYMRNSLTLPADEVEKLINSGTPYVIRIKVPRNREIKFYDVIRGWVSFNSNELDDKVLFKSDGFPTYHLANVVDDHLMQITHVIRGEEWIPSTPIHVLLYEFFGWEKPQFAHLPLILRPDGKGKLSKRAAIEAGFPVYAIKWTDPQTNESNEGFREIGFIPEGLINVLALLGWHPPEDREIYTLEELINYFELDRVGKSGAQFNFEKAKWINQQHILRLSPEKLYEYAEPFLSEYFSEGVDRETLMRALLVMRERGTTIREILELTKSVFYPPELNSVFELLPEWNEQVRSALSEFAEVISKEETDSHDISNKIKEIAKRWELKKGKFMLTIRVALTGQKAGPPLGELITLIGKEEVVRRINRVLNAKEEGKQIQTK